jgi:hypothetical protein
MTEQPNTRTDPGFCVRTRQNPARYRPRSEGGAAPAEAEGFEPGPSLLLARGRSGEGRMTWSSRIPSVTARARRGLAVPDAPRTRRGPVHLSGA